MESNRKETVFHSRKIKNIEHKHLLFPTESIMFITMQPTSSPTCRYDIIARSPQVCIPPCPVYRYLSHTYVGAIMRKEIKILGWIKLKSSKILENLPQYMYFILLNYVFQEQNYKVISVFPDCLKLLRFLYLKNMSSMKGKWTAWLSGKLPYSRLRKKTRKEKNR